MCAGVAQLVEQLICNQQVGGSNPFAGSILLVGLCRYAFKHILQQGKWPSGQRQQTVNLPT